MERFRVGFIFFKKERILSYMKPEKKPDRSRKEHKEIQGEMDPDIIGNEDCFYAVLGCFGVKINLLLVDKGLVWPRLSSHVILFSELGIIIRVKYLL